MSIPGTAITKTLTVHQRSGYSALTVSVSVSPPSEVWTATGELLASMIPRSTTVNGTTDVSLVLPVSDQTGFVDANRPYDNDFYYTVKATYTSAQDPNLKYIATKTYSPVSASPSGQDFELLPQEGNSSNPPAPGPSTGAEPAGLSSSTITALKSLFPGSAYVAPKSIGRLGVRWGFMGDSITDSSLTWPTFGPQWWAVAASMSGGRFWPAVMAGVAGQTTTQMLARIATNFPVRSIDVGFILGGTNDVSQAFPLATTASNITAMVSYLRSIGVQPVLGLIPPRAVSTGFQANVSAVNAWIKKFGSKNAIPVVDFFSVLVNLPNGEYIPALTADGVHPTPAGHLLMAQKVISTLDHMLSSTSADVVPLSFTDPVNLVPNGFFQTWATAPTVPTITVAHAAASSTLGAGTYYYKVGYVSAFGESLPSNEVTVVASAGDAVTITIPPLSNWQKLVIYRGTASGSEALLAEVAATGSSANTYVDNGSVTPGTAVPQTVDHYAAPGSWTAQTGAGSIQLTKVTTDTDFRGTAIDMVGRLGTLAELINGFTFATPPNAGDILAISFKIKTPVTATVSRAEMYLRNAGGTNVSTFGLSNVTSDALGTGVHLFYGEIACPASITNARIDLLTISTGQSFRFGEFSLINLTALGAA